MGLKSKIIYGARVLKPEGEIYASLCSKNSWDYRESGFPKLIDNTVINKLEGPEFDVPHYYADREDILELFTSYEIERIRHIDYCYLHHKKQDAWHYYIEAKKKTSDQ